MATPTAQATLPLSVIIPAFNRADTLPRALASVFAQSVLPAEVIVVDDCSTDDTGLIAERAGARVIRHPDNRGAAAARNTAIASAGQPWLAMLDSDDEWLPGHLERLWAHRDGHVLIAGASASCFDGDVAGAKLYAGTGRPRPHVLRSPAALIPANVIPASGVIVSRDAVVRAGAYDTTLRWAEDWDLWLRVLETGTGIAVPRVVCLYHRHAGQKSQVADGPRATHDHIVYSYANRPWWTASLRDRWTGIRAWDDLEVALSERRLTAAGKLALHLVARPLRLLAVFERRLHESMCRMKARRLLRGARLGRSPA